MLIRKAEKDDLETILKLTVENNLGDWKRKDFEAQLSDSNSFFRIVETGKHVIGYLLARNIADESEIINLCIAREHRKKGFGGFLLDDYIRFCRRQSIHKIFLEVRRSNENAVKLYQRYGFVETGRRRNYYGNPLEDALLMSFDLKPSERP